MILNLFLVVIAVPVAVGLMLFALRRLLFSATALVGATLGLPRIAGREILPTVTVLVPARNEESVIGETLEAVSRLDYPRDRLLVVLIDDCSDDRTAEIMQSFALARPNFRCYRVRHSQSAGKSAALNEALGAYGGGEIVYVLDADSAPEPGCVRIAVQRFGDDRVGAVGGAPFPSRSCTTFASYYAYLETLVHQSITARAKEILGLAPPLFGNNCAYRRSALEGIGGFRDGALLEDSDLVLALHEEGFVTRFEPRARSSLAMPRTVSSYFRQHTRWTRGFNDVLGNHHLGIFSRNRLPLALRIELCLFASGYLDRVLMAAALALFLFGLALGEVFNILLWVLAASFLSPLSSIFAALLIGREPLRRHWRLPMLPLFFAIDVAATFKGFLDSVADRPRVWHRVERESENYSS